MLPLVVTMALAASAPAPQLSGLAQAEGEDGPSLTELLDDLTGDIFAGRWINPQAPYWDPRRGKRVELTVLLGGEGSYEAVSQELTLPSIGGVVLNGLVRYYPVDRLAIVSGFRTYFGLDGVPAAGTTASSVASFITGIRYDLVREGRFSLLWDLYSGPSMYVFADLPSVTDPNVAATESVLAVGGEMGMGLAMRYSIGPFTGEGRGLVGGRAGATTNPVQRAGNSGPFSAVYAGVDVGLTWSLQ